MTHKADKPPIDSNGLDFLLKHPRIRHQTVYYAAENDENGNASLLGLEKTLQNFVEKYPVLITGFILCLWVSGTERGTAIVLPLKLGDLKGAAHRSDARPKLGAYKPAKHKCKGKRLAIVLEGDERDWTQDEFPTHKQPPFDHGT